MNRPSLAFAVASAGWSVVGILAAFLAATDYWLPMLVWLVLTVVYMREED